MTDKQLLLRYGLQHHPFQCDVPVHALWQSPALQLFLERVERLTSQGGFALISGEAGVGKSKALQLLASRLGQRRELVTGVVQRPQSSLTDFYRELGEVFGVDLRPANRFGGFQRLRRRWHEHVETTLQRPVLLVDEAQEMPTACLNELRLLSSEHFDSAHLLTVVLSGDMRLAERFRGAELLGLGSRIRVRLPLAPLTPDELQDFLLHALDAAGAPQLMTSGLIQTLAAHAAGNLRVLCLTATELLEAAAAADLPQLDEKLYLKVYQERQERRKGRSAGRPA
jgi:general secretion pathway protein A